MEPFESAGLWSLPDRMDTNIVGLLRYSFRDGFHLEIPFGTLTEMNHYFDCSCSTIPILYGTLRNGKKVTLIDTILMHRDTTIPGSSNELYRAQRGFIGEVVTESNPNVDQVIIEYPFLRDWAVLNMSSVTKDDNHNKYTANIFGYYKQIDSELTAGDGWKLLLSHIVRCSSPSVKGFEVIQDCKLKLQFDEPKIFYDIKTKFLNPLAQFLSFCINRRIGISNLIVRLAANQQYLDVGSCDFISSEQTKSISNHHMLLSMPQLENHLRDMLARWLKIDGDERRAISLLIGLSDEESIPLDLKFLTAAQALEAISRVDANELELDTDEFHRRFSIVSSSVLEKKVCEWVKRKLQHCNQRSVTELLNDLFNNIGDYPKLVAPNLALLLENYRDNRNYYTHRDDRRAKSLLNPEELFILTQGLTLFLKAATLWRMGFHGQDIIKIMDNCENTRYWGNRVHNQYSI